jgi:short-subunit dehydrogenase
MRSSPSSRASRAALPAMQARGSGRVCTVSSMAARMSTPGEAAYAASKAALSAYFEALAGELLGSGVSFHLVYPALIDLTGVDGDDALARTTYGETFIPAPVLARAMRRQLETGDFELYMPHTMLPVVTRRAADVGAAVEFMGGLYQTGTLHP